jgi:cytochrome bd-type quinol oxidase subunit 2
VRRLPFSIHQVAEYAIGLGLIAQAAQGGSAVLPVVVGAAVLVSAALTDGPLAGWKAVSRPHHRIVDIVLAVIALVLAVLPWSSTAVSTRVVLAAASALLGILIVRTSYAPPVVRPARSRGDAAEDIGRSAGRALGKTVKAYRDRRP